MNDHGQEKKKHWMKEYISDFAKWIVLSLVIGFFQAALKPYHEKSRPQSGPRSGWKRFIGWQQPEKTQVTMLPL